MEVDAKIFSSPTSFHLAGIIPVAGQPLDFKMDWPDAMMPIAPNYTLLEHAIHECAWAGCEAIWLVLHEDIMPLLRYRIGDYIQDPVFVNRTGDRYPEQSKKRIPIFYVPVHPKDRDRRDCLAWSVIYGSLVAFKVCSNISKWTIPDKYYVSFPYGVFNPEELRPFRKKISSPKNFFLTYSKNSLSNNSYTSFTFGKEDFIHFRRKVREGTGTYAPGFYNENGTPNKRLPVEERYSARFFEIKDVFSDFNLEDAYRFEPTSFYNAGSWESYREFLQSDLATGLSRPSSELMNYKEFNRTGVDVEE